MKIYEIYVYEDGEFKHSDTCYSKGMILAIIDRPELEFKFIVVNSINVDDYGRKEDKFTGATIYLGGLPVRKYRHEVESKDIESLKKKLTTLYKTDGTLLYYPNRAIETPEMIDICGGWFTIISVKEKPHRMAIVYYDWEQKEITQSKIQNIKASKRFKRDLFGDVLYINENFIS